MRPLPLFLLAGALLLAAVPAARAQRPLEVHPYAGYRVGGSIGVEVDEDTPGDLELDNGAHYGVMAGLRVADGLQLQISWNHQESRVDFDPRGAGETLELFDVGIDYFHVGVDYALEVDRLLPFLSLGLGTTHIDPQGVDRDGTWRFSTVFGGGVRYYLSDGFALRAQVRLHSTFMDSRSELFCDAQGGCYRTMDGGTLIQTEFSGGVVLAF